MTQIGSALTRKGGEVGMRLTDEMIREDDTRFKRKNFLAEFYYCGKEVPNRKSITNDDIRFYAWLCRLAYSLLKEQRAHILTIEQLENALDTVVWLETPVSENLADGYSLIMAYSHKYGYMLFDSPFGDNPSQDRLEYSQYGRLWRCWDRRPLEEQRKAVKWE